MLDPIGLQAFAIMYGNSNRQISSKFASLVTAGELLSARLPAEYGTGPLYGASRVKQFLVARFNRP